MGGYLGSGTSGSEFEAEEQSKAMTREIERERREMKKAKTAEAKPWGFLSQKNMGKNPNIIWLANICLCKLLILKSKNKIVIYHLRVKTFGYYRYAFFVVLWTCDALVCFYFFNFFLNLTNRQTNM